MKMYDLSRVKHFGRMAVKLLSFFIEIFLELLYSGQKTKEDEAGIQNIQTKRAGFDSRTIAPPQRGNDTERRLFAGAQFPINTNDFRSKSLPKKIKYVLPYNQNEVHATIYWFKYRRDKYTIKLLAEILWEEIIEQISGHLLDKSDRCANIKKWIISPAPSTSFLKGEKKWDQGTELLKNLENLQKNLAKNYLIDNNLLENTLRFKFVEIFTIPKNRSSPANTANTKKLDRIARIEKTQNKFMIKSSNFDNFDRKESQKSPIGLIIFDDVATTGSTLIELSRLAEESKKFEMILLISLSH